jgi:hypothetical protein
MVSAEIRANFLRRILIPRAVPSDHFAAGSAAINCEKYSLFRKYLILGCIKLLTKTFMSCYGLVSSPRDLQASVSCLALQKGGTLNRRQSEDKLTQFSNRLVQIKFIVLEIAMLVVFIAAVWALVRYELGF